MKYPLWITALFFTASSLLIAQKPAWVDNPGIYSAENFVSIGVAKDSKADKARLKSEAKAKKGIEKILKNKYQEKEIKTAMAGLKYEAYWLDPATKYQYCLALLPIQTIDKKYASEKNLQKAKSSAMDASKMLNEMTKDPDIIIIRVEDDNEGLDSETEGSVNTKTTDGLDSETEIAANVRSEKQTYTIDFKGKTLGGFKWLDQNNDSKYSFLGDKLVVTAIIGEDFIPEEDKKLSPRIEISGIKGDFSIEAKVSTDWAKYYHAGFGLVAHNGKDNVRSYFDYNGAYAYMKGYADGIALPESEKSFEGLKGPGYLKLVKKGYTFTAYYSSIQGEWIEIGTFETEFSDTFSVGLYFFNDNNSSVQFKVESLELTQ